MSWRSRTLRDGMWVISKFGCHYFMWLFRLCATRSKWSHRHQLTLRKVIGVAERSTVRVRSLVGLWVSSERCEVAEA